MVKVTVARWIYKINKIYTRFIFILAISQIYIYRRYLVLVLSRIGLFYGADKKLWCKVLSLSINIVKFTYNPTRWSFKLVVYTLLVVSFAVWPLIFSMIVERMEIIINCCTRKETYFLFSRCSVIKSWT